MKLTQQLTSWLGLNIIFICGALLTPTSLSAHAGNVDFANLRTSKIATIVMIPLDWSLNPMDENEFKQFGCSFSTPNPISIGNLIKVLENASIRDIDESNYKKLTSSSGIYLSFPDGTETKFLFAPSKNEIQISIISLEKIHESIIVDNEFIQTRKVKRQYVVASNSLIDSLFRWAADEKLVIHGWKSMVESCEKETSKYK